MNLSHAAKRTLLTWALSFLFLGLLSIILFLQWQTRIENLVLTRSAESVTQISIARKDSPTIELQKIDNQWWITSPLRIPANDQRIIPLLTVYTNPDLGYPIDSVDLVATGLEDPDVSLTFNNYRVAIGEQAIDETKRHALHGDRVRFVPDWVLPLLQGGISAVADLTVFGDELSAITVGSKESTQAGNGESLDEASLSAARALTAQQFVEWPRPDQPIILNEYDAEVTVAGQDTQWAMFKTDNYVAMQPANSHYAYVLPISDAPWLAE